MRGCLTLCLSLVFVAGCAGVERPLNPSGDDMATGNFDLGSSDGEIRIGDDLAVFDELKCGARGCFFFDFVGHGWVASRR